jgi:hypothetical protein
MSCLLEQGQDPWLRWFVKPHKQWAERGDLRRCRLSCFWGGKNMKVSDNLKNV